MFMVQPASLLTVTSALPSWLPGGGRSFPTAAYESVARPVGILYVFIMAVCPLLAWRKTSGELFWKRVSRPLITTVLLSVPLIFEWYQKPHVMEWYSFDEPKTLDEAQAKFADVFAGIDAVLA